VVVVTRTWQRVPGAQGYRPETDTVARAESFCIGLDWEGALESATSRTIDGTYSQEATAYQGALRIFIEDIAAYALVVLE
jgi:hypothetical protein